METTIHSRTVWRNHITESRFSGFNTRYRVYTLQPEGNNQAKVISAEYYAGNKEWSPTTRFNGMRLSAVISSLKKKDIGLQFQCPILWCRSSSDKTLYLMRRVPVA